MKWYSVYLCVILHVKHKKLSSIAILTWFLILGKTQDAKPLPVTPRASSSATNNKVYLILLRRSKAFH